jgi:hypothetical protein
MTTLGNSRLEDLRKFLDGFRFTVLHHALPASSQRSSHWDLLMEHPSLDAEKVLCFEALNPVSSWAAPVKLTRLPNHRKLYLTYEGPISEDRGQVTQVATGALTWLPSPNGSLHAQLLYIETKGGSFSITPSWEETPTLLIFQQNGANPDPSFNLNHPYPWNESWTLDTKGWPVHNRVP